MAKSLLLWSVVLVLAGGAAFAEPLPTEPPLFAVEPAEPAPALCETEELNNGFLKPEPMVASCHGDPCTKLSDCRPPNRPPDCALCMCIGPAFDDKWCSCPG